MRIVVVGGRGNLGVGYCNYLSTQDQVLVWDREEDLFNLDDKTLIKFKPDFLINFSVIPNFRDFGVDPESDYFRLHILGVGQIINNCKRLRIPLIHLSTREVVGIRDWSAQEYDTRPCHRGVLLVDESVQYFPLHAYGKTKLMSEFLIQSYELGTIIRLNTPYTDDIASRKGLIANLVMKSFHDKFITLDNSGGALRDPLHISDIVEMSKLIIEQKSFQQIFHAGGGPLNCLSLKEICQLANPDVAVLDGIINQDKGFLMDNSKAQRILGWAPRIAFRSWLSSVLATVH